MFSHRAIGVRLWSLDESLPTDATIKSHIRNIRRKLEQANLPDMIQTHYGRIAQISLRPACRLRITYTQNRQQTRLSTDLAVLHGC